MPVIAKCSVSLAVPSVYCDPGGDLLSHGIHHSTIGAAGLTAVFGMGTGVSPPLWPPGMSEQR